MDAVLSGEASGSTAKLRGPVTTSTRKVGGFEDESHIDCWTRDLFRGRRNCLDRQLQHGDRRSRLLWMSLQLRLWWLRLRLPPSSPSSSSLLWLLWRKRLRLLRHCCPGLCRSGPELLRHRAGCSELRRCCSGRSGCPSCSEGPGSAGAPGSAGSGQDLVIDRGQAPPPRRGMSGQAFELSSPPVAHGWRTTLRSFNSRC